MGADFLALDAQRTNAAPPTERKAAPPSCEGEAEVAEKERKRKGRNEKTSLVDRMKCWKHMAHVHR
jgi:hypothetical protein